ncbi:ABC transporter ATP-binding protein [Embleya scabrispora]|uniref:ABC transporter ATP-binding protein n=1 Tax=Embleya scabrispora TaxID=159449 RepID=A0A1T3NTT0_9ACTN|nr:ABC transporter ATP-binding protein [Embleya scabrispora]OPC80297.1 ABC transporter ATP-binding protein [Embleya scabrispora]
MSTDLAPAPAAPLLVVDGLDVAFRGREPVVRDVSFTLDRGECLAVVGESGSGKSVTARTLVGLTGDGARVTARRLAFDGTDLTALSEKRWRTLRGRRIGLVLQDALVSLDPLRTVGAEVAEALRTHAVLPRGRVGARVLDLLTDVGIPNPARRARQYPHQLSGGLRQRALIASALAAGPELLLADEPTTALDVTVQAQVLTLLGRLRDEGTSVLMISHDLAAVARLADRVAVMYAGRIVEHGPTERVLAEPEHSYTRALLAAVPTGRAKGTRLSAPVGATRTATPPAPPVGDVLLDVAGIGKSFRGPDGTRQHAVRDVSFTVRSGETLGVVGESGSGKTTAARIVLGWERPDTGAVRFRDAPWSTLPESARRASRGRIQAVQQDPLGSFDPRYPVARILGEAVAAAGLPGGRLRPTRAAHRARVGELLDLVGLSEDLLDRRPRDMSGGQRQRVAIARALAPSPELIVCDEPVSALDVSIQAQILDLLADLRAELGLALLFISHDLGVIRHVSDRILVMKDGRVVESGDAERVFTRPEAPYTRELLAAIPRPPASADGAERTTGPEPVEHPAGRVLSGGAVP